MGRAPANMSQKHDPEITPLPAPLPGLSVEIEAISYPEIPTEVDRNPAGAAHHVEAPVAAPTPLPPPVAAPVHQIQLPAPARRKVSLPGVITPPAAALPGVTKAPPVVVAPPPAAAPVVAPASDENETTDPEHTPAEKKSRSQTWWIIGGLALFALGVGSGALIWQPSLPGAQTTPVAPPPVALPSVPSSPVTVTPIDPTGTSQPPTTTPPVTALNSPPTTANPSENPGTLPVIPTTPTRPSNPTTPTNPTVAANPPPATSPTAPTPTVNPGDSEAGKPRLPKPVVKKPPVVVTAPKPKAPVEPPPPPPPVAPPVPTGPQKTLAQATIRQTMLAAQAGWPSCVKDAQGSNLSIGIVVTAAGQVQKADILGPLAQSATGRCITAEIRKLSFPPFTEGVSKQFFWSYQIPAN